MILIVLLGIIVLVLLGFSIFGLLYKPNPAPVAISPGPGAFNQTCLTEQVTCNPNLKGTDCNLLCREAQEGQEMSCVTLNRYTDTQKKEYGKEKSVCVLTKAKLDCDNKMGGIKVWSGWADPDRMEWDCLCSYPDYVGGPHCSTVNPGICGGGQFQWDVTTGKPPSYRDCTCPSGTTLMYTNDEQRPVCAASDIANWYTDLSKTAYP